MNIQVTGRKTVVTAALRDHVAEKMARLEELEPRARKASVILSVEKYRHSAEIHFHAEKVEMSARKTSKDMYASIDAAVAALVHQASRRKDALRSQHAKRKKKAAPEGAKKGRRDARA